MNCYYTFSPDGHCLVWAPRQDPSLAWSPREITGDTYELRRLFLSDEPMIFVPWEAVQILTNG